MACKACDCPAINLWMVILKPPWLLHREAGGGVWCFWRSGLACQGASGKLQWPSCLQGSDRALGAEACSPAAPQLAVAKRVGNWGKGLIPHSDWLAKREGVNRKQTLQPGPAPPFLIKELRHCW